MKAEDIRSLSELMLSEGAPVSDDGYYRYGITQSELIELKKDPDIQKCFGFETSHGYYYSAIKLEVI